MNEYLSARITTLINNFKDHVESLLKRGEVTDDDIILLHRLLAALEENLNQVKPYKREL